eukprot:TRINITY_DN52291_c0_g1_i1.p1 TRINITY_DN52291_c0_g1~~TRINITY_DN52291_c0_g1_i1.p1  ORF type:complete len:194 (-),score=29.05 TRINITY_DN52291_c0_g1_i1:30-539(-)
MCVGYDRQTGAKQVTAAELQCWLTDSSLQVLIFDIRGAAENSVSTLPNAQLLIPSMTGMAKAMSGLGKLSFDSPFPAGESIPEGAKVVCLCTAGLRSGFACKALEAAWKRQGVERRIYNLHGGIISWANAGGALVDPVSGSPRLSVHTFGQKWQPYVDRSMGLEAVTRP